MANVKISELPVATTVGNSDLVPIVQGGVTKQATVATQMSNVGLWCVSTQTFSAASSVTFDNVFTSDFRNYRIILEATHSGGYVSAWYRLRTSGVDNTTANYWYRSTYSDTVTYFFTGNADTKGFFMNITTSCNVCAQDIFLPQIAQRTAFAGTYYDQNTPFVWNVGSGFASTTQFDGIKLYPNTGTFTGRATIYGYND